MTIASNGLNYEVIIGVTSTPSFGNAFILDDPVRGLLDNTEYRLGGTVLVDITDDVENVSITRGRSRQLEQFNAGTCTIEVRDLDRTYDPTNEASPYYQGLSPRQPVQIIANNEPLFTGIVSDFDYSYEQRTPSNDIGKLTVSAVDDFDYLGKTAIPETTPSVQGSGARITTVLAYPEVNYPNPTNIAAGSSTLGAYEISANTSTIDYLNQIANAEKGYLFISKNGELTFKGRNDVVSVTPKYTFADEGNVPQYDSINAIFGSEQLYNRAVVTRVSGVEQTTSNNESINAFGLSTYVDSNILVSSDAQASDIASYVVSAFGQPDLRFAEINVGVRGSSTNDAAVLELEIADTITVEKNYASGSPLTRSETVAIEGISHNFDRDRHTVRLSLGKLDSRSFLRLDDAIFGVLNQSLLGF